MRTEKKSTVTVFIARLTVLAVVTACAMAASVTPASAEFGLTSFETDTHTPFPDPNNPSAPPSRHVNQAGAHADSTLRFMLRTKTDEYGFTIADGSLKDVELDLPAGFAGNPQAVPQCDPAQFTNLAGGSCPPSTQVGVSITHLPSNTLGEPPTTWKSAVYNLVPGEGETAAFGFYVIFVPVKVTATVRSDGDLGLRTNVNNISQAAGVLGQELTLWGVPADPVHDWERYRGIPSGFPAGIEARPFLTLPPTCPGPMINTLRVRAWGQENWVTQQEVTKNPDTDLPSGPQNCDKVPFDARLSMQPEDTRAGSPAPYTAKVSAAFDDNPRGIGNAHVKDVRTTLPEGVSISPPSADGLDGCAPEQLKLGSAADSACPGRSKIGDVEIATPLLPGPLTGEVYLRKPTREQLFSIAIVARGYGLTIKLPGEIFPDKQTGQITTVFRNNPQLPFETLTLRFKGGPRAPLTNPQTCGTKTTTTTITSWAGHSQTSTDSFTIDKGPDGGPCRGLGFDPSFVAGTESPNAGSSSTFSLTFGRSDADQDLSALTVRMPAGVTGRLALANQCPDAAAAAGACDASSRVGSVTVGSGGGPNPFFLNGTGVYMTGPYKGAPLGLSIVVPAIAGPFDLGTVVVRAAVHVDPNTAALTVVADPMPTILEGVPLHVRTVNVRMDRAGFMLNPTKCAPREIAAAITSSAGATANRSSHFQATNCASLPFAPKMTLKVGSRGRTRRDLTTPLSVSLQMPGRRQANMASTKVILPRTLNARLRIVNRACTLAAFNAGNCGAGARIGNAVAVSPLLRDPLRGDVYFVRSGVRRLPDLMVRLSGQVDIVLSGKVSIPRDLTLGTTFDTVPDVAVSRFTLNLVAGTNGPVGAVENLCTTRARRASIARLEFKAHNGRVIRRNQAMQIAGCSENGRKARRGGARRSPSRRGDRARRAR